MNHYMEMTWQQHAAVEDDFYRATKDIFRASGFRRNTCDLATAFKRFGNPPQRLGLVGCAARLWPDRRSDTLLRAHGVGKEMGQAGRVQHVRCRRTASIIKHELWCMALAGLRVNYHPVYPGSEDGRPWAQKPLWSGVADAGRLPGANAQLRLQNPGGLPGRRRVRTCLRDQLGWTGLRRCRRFLASAFWKTGFHADLIPSSEIESGALRIDDDGLSDTATRNTPPSCSIIRNSRNPAPASSSGKRQRARPLSTGWVSGPVISSGAAFDGNAALPQRWLPWGTPDLLDRVTASCGNAASCPHTVGPFRPGNPG